MKARVCSVWGFVAALLIGAASATANELDFVLVNETGVEINELHVSPTSADDWEEDVLGVDTLPSGDSVKISFEGDADTCRWDIQVTDSEGNALFWTDINLCKVSQVTLYYKNGKGTAELE